MNYGLTDIIKIVSKYIFPDYKLIKFRFSSNHDRTKGRLFEQNEEKEAINRTTIIAGDVNSIQYHKGKKFLPLKTVITLRIMLHLPYTIAQKCLYLIIV